MQQKFSNHERFNLYNVFMCVSPLATELWGQAQLHSEGGGRQHPPGPHLSPSRALQGRHHCARERGGRGRAPAVWLASVLHRAVGGRRNRDGGENGDCERPWCCQQHCEVSKTRKQHLWLLVVFTASTYCPVAFQRANRVRQNSTFGFTINIFASCVSLVQIGGH